MVEAFSADRAAQALNIWALPRRPECGENFGDLHAFGLDPEGLAVNAVAISEQEPWRLIPRKRLHELRCGPLGGGMFGDVEMHNAPAIMSQNKEHIQDPESNGGYHEEVYGYQLLGMILEKCSPGL